MFQTRPYQSETRQAIREAWSEGITRPVAILPTGAGKTVVFSGLTLELVNEGARVLILVHRDELVQQTAAKLQAFGGIIPGIVKARQNEIHGQVIVASVQTLYRPARLESLLSAGRITHVICDEVHHFASASNRRMLTGLGVLGGNTLAAGFTATFVRSDSRSLATDWTPVYEKTVAWAIEHGYLCDLEAIEIQVPDLNLDGVKRSRGDLGEEQLGHAIQDSSAAEIIPQAWAKYAKGRPTILFAPTVASCDDLVNGLMAAGIKTEAVYGTTPLTERRAIYDRVRTGVTQILASVGVLTEGFDMPEISCAILARPTESRGLYQQMVGRILRTFPGKDMALLLDVVGTSSEHDLCNVTDLTKTHDEDTEAEDRTPKPCECEGECPCDGLRGQCTRNQNMGLCMCTGCDCPASGDRAVTISVIRGAGDRHVDLFKGSQSAWLTTYRGNWFLPTRECFIILVPSEAAPGMWNVARTWTCDSPVPPPNVPAPGWLGPTADMETAMAIAENYASQLDPHIVSKGTAWRRKRASEGQLNWANRIMASLGLPEIDADTRSGPVSDVISRDKASQIVDPILSR